MALIKCPECGKEVSDRSKICIGCGFPIDEYLNKTDSVHDEDKKEEIEKCSICGSSNIDADGYCNECGAKIKEVKTVYEQRRDSVENVYTKANLQEKVNQKAKKKTELQTARIVTSILMLVFSLFVMFQSCAVGIANSLEGTGADGALGTIFALFMVVFGVIGITIRKSQNHDMIALVGFVMASIGLIYALKYNGIYSDLKIWALFMFAVGIIFEIAGYNMRKNKSINKMKVSYIITSIVIGFFVFLMITGNNDSSESKDNSTLQGDATSQGENEDLTQYEASTEIESATESLLTEFEYRDMSVKYISHEVVVDDFDRDLLVVYYEFTNNSNENKTFGYSFTDKVFQNGVELEEDYRYVNDEERNGDKEIKPGTTITVSTSFQLGEDRSPVVLEISPWISFNDRILLSLELELE